MAGGFGFEAGEHYEISRAVRATHCWRRGDRAPADALVLADGFSCREQIRQLSGRRALHLAEALARSLTAATAQWNGRFTGREPMK